VTTTLLDLDRLRRLAPPPDTPIETGHPARWPAVEAAIGTTLPADYKVFIATYGTGMFDDFLYVFNPFAGDADVNLLRQREVVLGAHAWLRERVPEAAPLPAFPEPGGLLPLGRTQNGDQLYWLTEGEPDRWPIVAFASRSSEPERHELTLVPFLARLLGGTLGSGVFPPELGEDGHVFTPG
jgi:SMI1-KNR4 cell-wall